MDTSEQVKREIKGREEVSLLVRTFYNKRIRKDEVLGPIFNEVITDWEEHLEKLTDFWESNLFYKRKYFGNPMLAHVSVDQKIDYKVEMRHFGIWLTLWRETLDELFEGEIAERAMARARMMSTNLFMAVYKSRPQQTRERT